MDHLSSTKTSNTVSSPFTPYCELPLEVVANGESSRTQHGDVKSPKTPEVGSFEAVSQRRSQSLVLHFEADGSSFYERLSRIDVLRTVQAAALPEPSNESTTAERLRPRSFVSGAGGDNTHQKKTTVPRAHSRDIRKLVDAFAVSNEPFIKVRNQAVLINTDPIRAIILRHSCLVFLPDGADSLVLSLQEHFRDATSDDGIEVPYEFKALEALLGTLCRHFEATYRRAAPAVVAVLDKLASGKISVRELEALREFKNRMQEFESQVDGVRRALMEILDDEEDMRLLYLTKLHEDPSLLHDLWSFDSEEAEVLIENYLQDIYSTLTKASLLQHRIQNTESLVMLKLDSTRNYLLGVDVFVSILTIAISIGTFVAGVFGMNLKSHLESTEGVFWGVTGVTILMMVMISLWGWLYFRHKGVFMWAALESNKTKE